ncbi:MAG: OmpA family protein [Acidobacteria bacterium]|nr:OmpA family protein [Acidobacteriota bacterium]
MKFRHTIRSDAGPGKMTAGRFVCRITIGIMVSMMVMVLGQSTPADSSPLSKMLTPIKLIRLDQKVGILSFPHRSGATVVEMQGTALASQAGGRMKVESKAGFLEIDINRNEIGGLPRAVRWGQDFFTYVFWAVSVDGRPQNLGEIVFNQRGEMSGINVTTPFQTFWLMITAEPHFAVSEPSEVVVLVSKPQDTVDTGNKAQRVAVDPIYYTHFAGVYSREIETTGTPDQVPLELIQARKAVQLAKSSGILKYPTPADQTPLEDELRTRATLQLAEQFLGRAEAAAANKDSDEKLIVQFARTAAQAAESARALSVGGVGQVYIHQLLRELDVARQTVDELQQAKESLEAARSNLNVELSRLQLDNRRLQEQVTESLSLNNRLQTLLETTQRDAERLRTEKSIICAELRRQLQSLGQLNQQGSDIVLTLASDILFDFDKFNLRPAARENLAKLAILRLLLFREAPIKFDGHTDWVGAEDYNQWLSEQRALSVAEYLLEQQLQLQPDEATRDANEGRLRMVRELLAMDFNSSQGGKRLKRNDILAQLGSLVEGFGFRRLAVEEQGKNERNRRVEIIFSLPEGQSFTSICDSIVGGTGL